jgi:exopolyphosphatase / guanosine-5'-triphosphate,3'-diphosphate pyrophosphatase
MRIAIIDLGTNTFNLLIAEVKPDNSWISVLKAKEAVKLGQGGIHKRMILPDAYQRGILALENHFQRIRIHQVSHVFAFGTSALRDASNGQEFLSDVKAKFGLTVEIISGDQEAEYIYLGVKQTIQHLQGCFLILDIGGGSNEFIIADKDRWFWKESYKLGMARLMEKFKPSRTLDPSLIAPMEKYFDTELGSLFEAVKKYNPQILIGASGSFDSFVNIIGSEKYPNDELLPVSQKIEMKVFQDLFNTLIHSSEQERAIMPGLEPVRRDMIVLAVIFVQYIIKKLAINQLYQSSYSLKEGALWKVIPKISINFNPLSNEN